jgi:hypothetical protein
MTRYLLLFDSYGLVFWGTLSDERTGLSFVMLVVSPAQSFLGQSPLGLVTIFYSLRFEASLFVASYDSQGYGGGIRPLLHTANERTDFVLCLYLGTDHIENTVHLLLHSCPLLRKTCLPSGCLEAGLIYLPISRVVA